VLLPMLLMVMVCSLGNPTSAILQNSAPVTSVGTANTPIQFDAGRSNMLVMTALDAVLVRSLAL